MALLTKSPATSGDARNLVWHTTDNGATWYASWTLSPTRVISQGYNKSPRSASLYDMPHDSVLTVANTNAHQSPILSADRQYEGYAE